MRSNVGEETRENTTTIRRRENYFFYWDCSFFTIDGETHLHHSILSNNSFPPPTNQVPQTLFRPEGYDHREALFGVPPYGGSIAQSVYYAASDLCDPTVDTRGGYPIRAKDNTGKMEPWPSPYILMVDRGGCSFVQKVRNAQRSGAAGVVIADNTCLCSDKNCVSANGQDVCQPAEPIMADDGSGGDISIPSFLMFKVDADQIKAELQANHMVQVEMQWALPKPDDRVEYDLWTTPSDPVSKDFQKKFEPVAQALGDRAYFTPHMYIYDGVKSNCQGFDGKNMCFNLCTNNGRYCATDPDNDLDHGISGADVVKESLRRICIWKHYGEADGVGKEWWNYVSQFMERCDNPDYFANDDCAKDCYKHAKINEDIIERCMRDSGGLEKDTPNTFLDLEMQAQVSRGVVILPTAFVNTVALRGGLNVDTVFTAICNGYLDGTEPSICKECSGCGDFNGCIANKKCKGKGGGGVSTHTFMSSILFICIAFGGAAFYHYRKTREEMREQVRGILAEYMPLEGDDGHVGSPMDFARRGGSEHLMS